MIAKSDAASIFRDTRGSRSIEISAPGAFTAVGFSGQQKKPGASAAERGRPSLFKTIDEDRRQRHDYINRSGRSTYPRRISVPTSGAIPVYERRRTIVFRGTRDCAPAVPALRHRRIRGDSYLVRVPPTSAGLVGRAPGRLDKLCISLHLHSKVRRLEKSPPLIGFLVVPAPLSRPIRAVH
jgi:hypothetical protein